MDLEKLLKEYSSRLRKFLSYRMRNQADVDDVLQEVLIKSLKHFKNIREPGKFQAWLYRTARTTLIDYYRKSDRYVLGALADIPVEKEEQAARQELSGCVRPFINHLPEKYREALNAVELGGASQKDAARALGLSYSGLKSRVQRGRRMLQGLFRDCCEYEFDVRGGVTNFRHKAGGCRSCGQ